MKTFVLSVVLLTTGCTLVNMQGAPPVDWPVLREEIIHDFVKTQQCAGAVPPLTVAAGCAYPDFAQGICWIFLASDDEYVLEHERAHCKGYDHYNASTVRDLWAKYKEAAH